MTCKCPVLQTRWFFVGTTWNNFSVCYISGFPDWISSYNSCKPDKGHWKCERCKYFAIQLLLQASVTNTKLTNLITGNKQWLFLILQHLCLLWSVVMIGTIWIKLKSLFVSDIMTDIEWTYHNHKGDIAIGWIALGSESLTSTMTMTETQVSFVFSLCGHEVAVLSLNIQMHSICNKYTVFSKNNHSF